MYIYIYVWAVIWVIIMKSRAAWVFRDQRLGGVVVLGCAGSCVQGCRV